LTDEKQVSIPIALYTRFEATKKIAGFSAVSEYLVFVLEQFISDFERQNHSNVANDKDSEKEKIKGRLRALGYLD